MEQAKSDLAQVVRLALSEQVEDVRLFVARFQFRFIKTLIIIINRRLQHRMVGVIGLDNRSPGDMAPPDAAQYLADQLKGALLGGEIGHI